MEKFKIKGMPSESAYKGMPFGRRIEHLRTIASFKERAKSTHLSQKRQTYTKAIREAIRLHGATEYYCSFHAEASCFDDSFEFWYV